MLGHFDITMTEHLGNILNRYVIGKSNRRGERVTCAMSRELLIDSAQFRNFFQPVIHGLIGRNRE